MATVGQVAGVPHGHVHPYMRRGLYRQQDILIWWPQDPCETMLCAERNDQSDMIRRCMKASSATD
jgi:hypothetical protein